MPALPFQDLVVAEVGDQAYREFRAPERLREVVACTWTHEAAWPDTAHIVPDGCVDLVWFADGGLILDGPDTGPRTLALPSTRHSAGVRLRPGLAGAFLHLPADEVRDRQVPAELVLSGQARRLAEALAGAPPAAHRGLLLAAVTRCALKPDPMVAHAARLLSRPGARVAAVAAELGVTERRLHRRMCTAVGYGPKVLARVARLRRLAVGPGVSLAQRAMVAGYASQSHMTDEVRRLTGLTPVRFLEDASLTAA